MLDTPLGERLRDLAADPSFKVLVDLGCGDGKGTTRCLMNGLLSRPDWKNSSVVCIDADRTQWALCKREWETPWTGPERLPMHILLAHINEKMDPMPESPDEQPAYAAEEMLFASSRLLRLRRADLVVLDAGLYSFEHDWNQLRALNPRVICIPHIQEQRATLFETLRPADYGCEFLNSDQGVGVILQRRASE